MLPCMPTLLLGKLPNAAPSCATAGLDGNVASRGKNSVSAQRARSTCISTAEQRSPSTGRQQACGCAQHRAFAFRGMSADEAGNEKLANQLIFNFNKTARQTYNMPIAMIARA